MKNAKTYIVGLIFLCAFLMVIYLMFKANEIQKYTMVSDLQPVHTGISKSYVEILRDLTSKILGILIK